MENRMRGPYRAPRVCWMFRINGLSVEPIIGLETHVQLATRTKMFCDCPVGSGSEPNSRICPVCLGLPGSLPVINRHAVELAIRVALALRCQVARVTAWDRKSYFYPDLPKNYQISQYARPLATCGVFEFPFDGRYSRVRIERAHLEEDAGKSTHDQDGTTTIDLNRAGTPLLEIVSCPDIHSSVEARAFTVQVQRLVRYLGVSEANMQEGQLRFEPNINVRIHTNGHRYATPIVEVKNLNSFRALQGTIDHEITRQVTEWQQTGQTAVPGNKSNRGWDEKRGVTVPQREKEEPHDYRYFPDPDLVPLTTDPTWVAELKDSMLELPVARAARLAHEYKVKTADAPSLVDDRPTADLLDHAAEAGGDKPTLAKHFLSFWAHYAHERHTTIGALGISPGRLAELANLVADGRLSATAAAQVAKTMLTCHEPPSAVATRLGLLQSHDEGQIGAWVDEVLAANQRAVQDAINNRKKRQASRSFLAGQVMRRSRGRADPRIVSDLIEQKLGEFARP